VAVRPEDDEVVFEIDDEGPGVAPEEVERIFDVYQTNAVEEGKGSGLGLPLSRRLARLLGGELSAVPRGAGPNNGGGCFILRLPAEET
jgi:two-component system sensor histidine kinase GlrK